MNEAPQAGPARRPVPLRLRPVDRVLLAFFAVNLFFIACHIDVEQLTVANPGHFHHPLWPPSAPSAGATTATLNGPADGEDEPADG